MNINLAIKFGSNEITIYRKQYGIIAKEPAYLAVVEDGKNIKVKATGKDAEKLFHSKSSNVTVYQPIENSEIVNEKMAIILLRTIIQNVIPDKMFLTHLSALVSVPCALNEHQLVLIRKVLHESGVNSVSFVQNGVSARAHLEIDSYAHVMVVDIGKYITDISVMNDYDFNFGRMYFIGGEDMDKSITTYIADNHNLEVSDMTSEAVKNDIASLYERDMCRAEYIGIDEHDKFVRHDITANEVRVAVLNVYDKIFGLILDTLKTLPKEVSADIYNNGIMFVGGGSRIAGLYEYAKKKLDLPIIVPDDSADSVILGAGKLLTKGKDFINIKV